MTAVKINVTGHGSEGTLELIAVVKGRDLARGTMIEIPGPSVVAVTEDRRQAWILSEGAVLVDGELYGA